MFWTQLNQPLNSCKGQAAGTHLVLSLIPWSDFLKLHLLLLACSEVSRLKIVQCNPDLVTSNLVTNLDLVTILEKTIFLVHKNISFSDNLVFLAPSI